MSFVFSLASHPQEIIVLLMQIFQDLKKSEV